MFLRKTNHLQNSKIAASVDKQGCIPFSNYQHLYDAIVTGEVHTVKKEFLDRDSKISVNMPFDYEDQDICGMFGKKPEK